METVTGYTNFPVRQPTPETLKEGWIGSDEEVLRIFNVHLKIISTEIEVDQPIIVENKP